jgi:hypothetical protein
MTISHADFFRLLPKALDGRHHVISENSIRVTVETGSVEIGFSNEGIRKAGAFELPVTFITVQFENISDEARQRFLERFDMTYHKGGG